MKLFFLIFILVIFSLARDSFIASDEAINLQMVKNMQEGPSRFLLRPSYDPGGHRDWATESMPHVLMTPFFHYVFYAFNKILPIGLISSSAVLVGLFLFVLLFIFQKLIISSSTNESVLEILMLSIFPISYYLHIEHEALMSIAGFVSLYFCHSGLMKKKRIHFLFSGIFLGISFLSKLWLVCPFGVGLLFILFRSIYSRECSLVIYLQYSLILISSFMLTSSLHLLAVQIISPGDVNVWLNHVYFGVITGAGDYGSKSNGGGWGQPFYYYFYTMLRDLFVVIPFVILGLLHFGSKNNNKKMSHFDFSVIGVVCSVLILSFNSTKEPLYILPSYLGVVFLCCRFFIDSTVNIRFFKQLCFIQVISQIIFFGSVWMLKLSDSLDLTFIMFSFSGSLLSLLLIYIVKIKHTKIPVLMSVLIFSLPLVYNHLRLETRFNPVVSFIQDHNKMKSSPRDSYVVSDFYSQIGFKIWNRVKKYKWLLGDDVINRDKIRSLLRNEQYRYFILTEENKFRLMAIEVGLELGLKLKTFEDVDVLYK